MPDVTGAILPGRLSAHITRFDKSCAFSKSTPPGFEAKSIINGNDAHIILGTDRVYAVNLIGENNKSISNANVYFKYANLTQTAISDENGLAEKPLDSPEDARQYREVKSSIKDFFDKYFRNLLLDGNGNRLDVTSAMRNMRNVNIMCNCNATERVIQLEECIVNSMKEIGYSDEEISSIQSQMCVFPLETGKKLGDFKSTTISFVDTNDREVDLNVGETRRDAIKRFASESIISDTIKALSKNEAIYALAGTGEHGLKKYTREGKAMPVCISRIISNALENSIVNSRENDFNPIDIHKLIEGVREIREGAAKGISLQDLMNKLDGELNYTGVTRINESQAKDLVDMDILTDKLLAEKKNDYRLNGYKSQSSVHTQGKGLAEEEISSIVKERKIDASLKNIVFSQRASSIKNGIGEIREEVQELENPTRDEDSSISFED